MKRSEMVEGLTNLIEITTVPSEEIGYSAEVVADTILDYLEQLGMLPPPQANKIIYDDKGPKHNESTRQWDEE